MKFTRVVQRRRMVRSYEPGRRVPRETLEALFELAVRAPSAGYTQGWQFVVLESPDSIKQFWAASTPPDEQPDAWLAGMQTAPVLVLCLSDKDAYLDRYAEADKGWIDRSEHHWPVPYWDVDTGMAALLLLLAATDERLASCFFGVPGDRWAAVREAFDIDERLRFVGVVSLGYPAPDRKSASLRRGRRPIDSVVRYV